MRKIKIKPKIILMMNKLKINYKKNNNKMKKIKIKPTISIMNKIIKNGANKNAFKLFKKIRKILKPIIDLLIFHLV
jgi:hypothetical protein